MFLITKYLCHLNTLRCRWKLTDVVDSIPQVMYVLCIVFKRNLRKMSNRQSQVPVPCNVVMFPCFGLQGLQIVKKTHEKLKKELRMSGRNVFPVPVKNVLDAFSIETHVHHK